MRGVGGCPMVTDFILSSDSLFQGAPTHKPTREGGWFCFVFRIPCVHTCCTTRVIKKELELKVDFMLGLWRTDSFHWCWRSLVKGE